MRSSKSYPISKLKLSDDLTTPRDSCGYLDCRAARLPKRWIVERTIAWLNRCRRLAKDWENPNRNALAFLKLASIRLMLRKLCNA
jgi:transposase